MVRTCRSIANHGCGDRTAKVGVRRGRLDSAHDHTHVYSAVLLALVVRLNRSLFALFGVDQYASNWRGGTLSECRHYGTSARRRYYRVVEYAPLNPWFFLQAKVQKSERAESW